MIWRLNPLTDPRWLELISKHKRSSVFHTREWLESLHRAYQYEPVAFSTSPPGADLKNAVLCCWVKSWLTGQRLVSLPFSDHCDLLVEDETELRQLLVALRNELLDKGLRFVELRPVHPLEEFREGPHATHSLCLHQLDLTSDLNTLFRNCHKDSIQRKIRRAQRENLVIEQGRSRSLLDSFHRLLTLTRQRHGAPPQPMKWFESLIDCFGSQLKIAVAFKNARAVAAILTLQYRDTLVYKYGGSHPKFQSLGGMHLLLWEAIREAKGAGLGVLDLGRSDWDQPGLVTFKNRWGAKSSELIYWRLSRTPMRRFHNLSAGWKQQLARGVFPYLPQSVLCLTGNLIYRHLG